jgi:hypothetical protein
MGYGLRHEYRDKYDPNLPADSFSAMNALVETFESRTKVLAPFAAAIPSVFLSSSLFIHSGNDIVISFSSLDESSSKLIN